MVPLAGIEPALLAELDFESSASTNSATGAIGAETGVTKRADYSRDDPRVNGGEARKARCGDRGDVGHVIPFASTARQARDRTAQPFWRAL